MDAQISNFVIDYLYENKKFAKQFLRFKICKRGDIS